ncbi:uncharacterized protein F54H12.2-like [Mizuhopecten yessoensis]|uniref:uncharacterized protein F54H12.2-like n=1 Tax=Mizuhopecten yessoensis TaxID=6573 RepID=UPI000B45BF7F|nr:uncharacterized protein F54H12.2-like [Mizuhopecten yessoensis]
MEEDGLPAELMLFSLPPTQVAVEKLYYVDCRPVTQICETGPVEFHISGQTSDYIALDRSVLYVKARIVKQDGTPLSPKEQTTFINLPLQTLWGQVEVSLQGKLLSLNSGNYAYKAYIQTLLNYGLSAKKGQLTAQLYYQDTPGSMDATDPDGGNSGLFERNEFSKNSASVDMVGRLCEDVCHLNRYILNGVDLDIKLYRNRTPFVLMSGVQSQDYRIELQEVMFRLCRVQVNVHVGVLVGHNKALELSPAKYPFTSSNVKVATIPDPFNFRSYDASSVGVFVNNVSVPYRPHKLDAQCYVTAFRSLFEVADKADLDSDNALDRDDWPVGYALYGFQLTPNFGEDNHLSPNHNADARLEITFASTLTETVSCVLYSEFDDIFQIDQTRNVLLASSM